MMRLLSVTFIVLLTLLTAFIAKDSRSHYVAPRGTSHGQDPSTWISQSYEVVVYYWEIQFDDYDNSEMGHSSTKSFAYAARTVRHPPGSSSETREEEGYAFASVAAKGLVFDDLTSSGPITLVPDGEYCLLTKIVFEDNTPPNTGVDTVKIGEDSTVSDESEYERVANGEDEGREYVGEQYFNDRAIYTMEVTGANRLGSIARSWIKNEAETSYGTYNISVDHEAAAAASQ